MNCGVADCTGVHKTSKPWRTWCPRTKERANERKRARFAEDSRTRIQMAIRVNNSRNRADQRRLDACTEAQGRLSP